jgi:hypothetical protein
MGVCTLWCSRRHQSPVTLCQFRVGRSGIVHDLSERLRFARSDHHSTLALTGLHEARYIPDKAPVRYPQSNGMSSVVGRRVIESGPEPDGDCYTSRGWFVSYNLPKRRVCYIYQRQWIINILMSMASIEEKRHKVPTRVGLTHSRGPWFESEPRHWCSWPRLLPAFLRPYVHTLEECRLDEDRLLPNPFRPSIDPRAVRTRTCQW